MSAARPGRREMLEREYLAMVRGRELPEDQYLAEVQELQRRLEQSESQSCAREGEWLQSTVAEDGDASEAEAVTEFAEASELARAQTKALRMTAFALGALREVAENATRPNLSAWVALIAVGAHGCPSMRALAQVNRLSIERVSQMVEATQKRFNFPRNQNQKSEAARGSYQALARERKGVV